MWNSDRWRFVHFLIHKGEGGGGRGNPTQLKWKILLAQNIQGQSDCLILLHKISREWLYLFNSFFVQQFSIYDGTLLNKFWLLITFGVFPKVSCKVKLKFLKIQNVIFPSICASMGDRNVNPKITHVHYIYF